MVDSKKENTEKQRCTCSVCGKSKEIFTPDGWHNFIAHIIDGEQRVVCMDCKMELLQNKRQRNGF